MDDGVEEQAGGSGDAVALALVEAAGGIAGIQHDALGAGFEGASLQSVEQQAANALALEAGFHGHEAHLPLGRGVEMEPAYADEPVAGPAAQVQGVGVAVVVAGLAGLIPGLAQDAPAQVEISGQRRISHDFANIECQAHVL